MARATSRQRLALDEQCFASIDSEQKAYVLGWVASHAAIKQGSLSLEVPKSEQRVLGLLKHLVDRNVSIRARNGRWGVTLASQPVADHLRTHLSLALGAKA